MSATRDEHGYVLCCHGRQIWCHECGEEYAKELNGPAGGAPAVVDERSDRATAESTGSYTRNQMAEVLTALWNFQRSPDCWCDHEDGSHSQSCSDARDVTHKHKSLAYPEDK
jgi:hypothetical protein